MRKIIHLLLSVAAMTSMTACHNHGQHNDEEQKTNNHPADAIVLTKEKIEASGVKTSVVRPGAFSDVIAVSGKILSASGDETTVAATVSGIIRMSRPLSEGQQVGAGQSVFVISSRGLEQGDAVQKARIEYEAARRNYERDMQLVKDQIVSQKHFEDSKTAFDNARLAYEALGAGQGDGTSVTTRSAGYVKALMVKDGDYVSVGQPLLTLTRNRSLYLQANVPEHYAYRADSVTNARFRLGGSDRIYNLSDLNGHKVASAKTMGTGHYLPLTFEMNNGQGLVAGAFADIWLECGLRHNVISLPTAAITEQQGLYFVYVLSSRDNDCDSYRQVEVTLGATDGERTEIVSGLKGGDKVVVAGATHVKLAAASGTIPGHSHNH